MLDDDGPLFIVSHDLGVGWCCCHSSLSSFENSLEEGCCRVPVQKVETCEFFFFLSTVQLMKSVEKERREAEVI